MYIFMQVIEFYKTVFVNHQSPDSDVLVPQSYDCPIPSEVTRMRVFNID